MGGPVPAVQIAQNGAVTVRVDKWLWSVRVFKSRSQATAACASGRVSVNDRVAKPATGVGPGDVVTARRSDREVVLEVVDPITERVGAAKAAECVIDHSPAPDPRRPEDPAGFGRRDRGAGRPTKRDRREIDRLRGRG